MRHTFEAEQWLPYPVEVVFAFFANPENLPRLMPTWQKARIEQAAFTSPPPRPADLSRSIPSIAAGAGTRMTLSFRPFPLSPLRVPWDAEIDQFEWNDHFCDKQLRGPFAFWHHCHSVRPEVRDEMPGTLLRDCVEYELPFGRLGEIAHGLFVRRQIKKIFSFRQQKTIELIPLMRTPRVLNDHA